MKQTNWNLPGGPVVKTSPSNTGDTGSIPGWGAKIPYALWLKTQNRNNIVMYKIKSFKNGSHQRNL